MKVTYNGTENLVWNLSDQGRSWYAHYTLTESARSDYYIALEGNQILKQYWGWTQITPSLLDSSRFILRGETSGPGAYLRFNGNRFIADNSILIPGADTRVYLVKVEPAPIQFSLNVMVDEPSHGTVSGILDNDQPTGEVSGFTVTSEDVVDGIGKYNAGNRAIVATPSAGYLFDHWEFNGARFDGDTEAILDGELNLSSDNTQLKAVFKKDSTVTDEMTKEEIEDQLRTWAADMLSDTVTTGKTAQVSDYENRIYEITMEASSGVRRVMPTVDLEFITDVSRSMFFPATLEEVATFTQGTKNETHPGGHYTATGQWVEADSSLYDWLNTYGDKNTVYYTIADNNAATIMAVYYDKNYNNPADTKKTGVWRYQDSSNVNPPDNQNLAGLVVNMTGKNEPWSNNLTGRLYTQVGTLTRMDYLKMAAEAASKVVFGVDPEARIGLVTFAASANEGHFYGNDSAFTSALEAVDLKGGTNQGDGLDKGKDLFSSNQRTNPTPKRVAILITDGAPNQDGVTWTTIGNSAKALKNLYGTDSVELYTLGLSMSMVGETNRNNLKEIATGGKDGGHWAMAENGSQVVEAVKKIISSIVNEASLRGTITDTIDEAFYPVDSEGNPLSAGDYIDLNGKKLNKYSLPSDGKYGRITYDGKNYGVEWSNQVVAYDPNHSPTWTGKVFVKAREDFLGGNSIPTNAGKNDKFVPTKYIVDGKEYNLRSGDDAKLSESFETPYVNVDELSMTQNSTEWTVYLGTEVNPKEQIAALMDEIKVREVASASRDYMIESRNAMLGTSATDRSETFPLSQAVDVDKLSPEEWEGLFTNGTLTMDYSAYGHDNVGKLVLTLSKSGDTADVNPHVTTQTGERVEQYIITAVYIPAPVNEQLDYHTTPGGAPGAPTETMTSANTHVINVFAKSLRLFKRNEDGTRVLTGAKFAIYRTWRADDEDETKKVRLNGKDYFIEYAEREVDGDGALTFADLTALRTGEERVLVETKAPDGYNLLATPITVGLNIASQYRPVPPKADNGWRAAEVADAPYDWIETASLALDPDNAAGMVALVDETGAVMTPTVPDSLSSTVHYMVRNNPGVTLPSTGGAGPETVYGLGAALAALSGLCLALRRKKRLDGE